MCSFSSIFSGSILIIHNLKIKKEYGHEVDIWNSRSIGELFDKYFKVENSYYDNHPIGSFTNTMTRESVDAVNGTLSPIDIVSFLLCHFS